MFSAAKQKTKTHQLTEDIRTGRRKNITVVVWRDSSLTSLTVEGLSGCVMMLVKHIKLQQLTWMHLLFTSFILSRKIHKNTSLPKNYVNFNIMSPWTSLHRFVFWFLAKCQPHPPRIKGWKKRDEFSKSRRVFNPPPSGQKNWHRCNPNRLR